MVRFLSLRPCASGFMMIMLFTAASQQSRSDELGRLFTSNKQRAELDSLRLRYPGINADKQQTGTANKTGASAIAGSSADKTVINGIVMRRDGKNTVWINGTSRLETREPDAGVDLHLRR